MKRDRPSSLLPSTQAIDGMETGVNHGINECFAFCWRACTRWSMTKEND
jgi:hypothetical protein